MPIAWYDLSVPRVQTNTYIYIVHVVGSKHPLLGVSQSPLVCGLVGDVGARWEAGASTVWAVAVEVGGGRV